MTAASLTFWLIYPATTLYLLAQWQRYEPTPLPLDGAAGFVAFVFAFYLAAAVGLA